jgi:hypothetical protein
VFGAVVGTGAGLHVAAVYISGESHIDATATVLTVAIPVFVFELILVTIYSLLLARPTGTTSGSSARPPSSSSLPRSRWASVQAWAPRCSSSPHRRPSFVEA